MEINENGSIKIKCKYYTTGFGYKGECSSVFHCRQIFKDIVDFNGQDLPCVKGELFITWTGYIINRHHFE